MNYLLGINAFGQNPSACLVQDGKLISFSHEERFNRLKGSTGLFPSLAVIWCLNSNGLKIEQIDKIAVNWDCNKYPYNILQNLISYKIKDNFSRRAKPSAGKSSITGVIDYLNFFSPSTFKQKILDALRESGHKGKIPEIVFVDHHLSHAYQTYYQSGFKDSLVLIADGHGEENCVSGYKVINGQFSRILNYQVPYSLGWFYGGFTAYLGFQANRDEGKMMGLAAFGECRHNTNPWLERLDKILKITNNGYEIDPYFFKMGSNDFHPRFTNTLVDYITSFDKEMVPITLNEKCTDQGIVKNKYLMEKYIDLAYAVQTRLEEALVALVNNMLKNSRLSDLCLAGGIFMNCKANGTILKNCAIDNIFIHPASSDDGSCIGAAFYTARQLGFNVTNPLKTVQYGASFTNAEILSVVKGCGLSYQTPDDIGEEIAKIISINQFAGWFQGGAEMGARALGGRSIIASPVNPDTKDAINAKVKYRETWRPYCPSLLEEFKSKYLADDLDSPYMILAENATEELRLAAPSTVHVDNTVRPQTVNKDVLPLWYHLIESVQKYTGHPVILNTSFNVRSEPIVNSPHDAIRTFYSTGLNALAMGDILITK